MTYATQQDLVDRFGTQEIAQLTDAANGAVIDATVVARALGDADATIDGYLATRYALPLASVPAVLVRVAADIARYYLFDARAPQVVKDRYDAAVGMLKGLSSGAATLGGVAQLTPSAGAVAVATRTPARRFTSDVLDSFERT